MRSKIQVPNKLEDITLEQYARFEKVNTEENKDTSFLIHKTIQIFCNLELKNIVSIKYNSTIKIINILNKLFQEKPKLKERFTFKGVEYGLIPDLSSMSFGEYIDLDNTYGNWDKMDQALSVLYRPIVQKHKDKYLIEKYKGLDTSGKFKDLGLDIVFGVGVFFYNLGTELLSVTLNYLEKEIPEEMSYQDQANLVKNGDTIRAYIDYLRGTYLNSTKLPGWD